MGFPALKLDAFPFRVIELPLKDDFESSEAELPFVSPLPDHQDDQSRGNVIEFDPRSEDKKANSKNVG